MAIPGSWSEFYARWCDLFACHDAEVEAWVTEALEAFDPDTETLPPWGGIFSQKIAGVLLALEDHPGELIFIRDQREMIAGYFARYLGGVMLDGPEWRMSPDEHDRLTREQMLAEADFGRALDSEAVEA